MSEGVGVVWWGVTSFPHIIFLSSFLFHCPTSSSELIKEAKRQRKVLGGGWRQAGMIAAAGLYALENNIPMLERDHENAHALAKGLSQIPGKSFNVLLSIPRPCSSFHSFTPHHVSTGISCDPSTVSTNIIYFRVLRMSPDELVNRLRSDHNVYIGGSYKGGNLLRAVTNLMVGEAGVQKTIQAIASVMHRGMKAV